MVAYKPLNKKVLGVKKANIAQIRKPNEKFGELLEKEPKDELLRHLQTVFAMVTACSSLSKANFGIFGSLLHGFYHPKFSDIDLIIYGRWNANHIREVLNDLYADSASSLRNEFETDEPINGKSDGYGSGRKARSSTSAFRRISAKASQKREVR